MTEKRSPPRPRPLLPSGCRSPASAPEAIGIERQEALCSNIFACRAAAEPWRRRLDMSAVHCRACSCAPHGPVQLVLARRFEAIGESCPVCLWLFGNGRGGRCTSPSELADHLVRKPRKPHANWASEVCFMCGFVPARVALDLRPHQLEDSTVNALEILREALETGAPSTSTGRLERLVRESFGATNSERMSAWMAMRRRISSWLGDHDRAAAPHALRRKLDRVEEQVKAADRLTGPGRFR